MLANTPETVNRGSTSEDMLRIFRESFLNAESTESFHKLLGERTVAYIKRKEINEKSITDLINSDKFKNSMRKELQRKFEASGGQVISADLFDKINNLDFDGVKEHIDKAIAAVEVNKQTKASREESMKILNKKREDEKDELQKQTEDRKKRNKEIERKRRQQKEDEKGDNKGILRSNPNVPVPTNKKRKSNKGIIDTKSNHIGIVIVNDKLSKKDRAEMEKDINEKINKSINSEPFELVNPEQKINKYNEIMDGTGMEATDEYIELFAETYNKIVLLKNKEEKAEK